MSVDPLIGRNVVIESERGREREKKNNNDDDNNAFDKEKFCAATTENVIYCARLFKTDLFYSRVSLLKRPCCEQNSLSLFLSFFASFWRKN